MDSATARTAARILRILPRERITRALGHLTDAKVPGALLRPVLSLYARAYRVDLGEAVLPAEGFATFNEFFTRRLRDGLRPVDPDPTAVVSPADGFLDDAGAIEPSRTFLVKGQRYDVAELVGDATEAKRYANGLFAVVYLSPRDYHRVHSPVDGDVARVRHIPGTLFPVNSFGVRHVPLLFSRNERVVITVQSPALGEVGVVMVGAMIVGKITLAFDGPQRPAINGRPAEREYRAGDVPRLDRGDELGAFQLGSTVVLLLPPPATGRWVMADGVEHRAVRLGQAIARRSDA